MNNTTSVSDPVSAWLIADYSTREIELVNMVQSGISCLATLCIFIKVFDFGRFFKSVKESRQRHKRERERKELERVRKLINSVRGSAVNGDEVNLDDLLSDDDETEYNDAGIMPITRKKKTLGQV